MNNTTLRPNADSKEVTYYKGKVEELTMEYQGKGHDLDQEYFTRLNAYRDAIKYHTDNNTTGGSHPSIVATHPCYTKFSDGVEICHAYDCTCINHGKCNSCAKDIAYWEAELDK